MATGSVPLRFTAADPTAVASGPKALAAAPVEKDAVAALTAEWPKSGELYFILTPDAADSTGVVAFRAAPAKVFAAAVEAHTLHALDAITAHRPYRKSRDMKTARKEILRNSGKHFDPKTVEAFSSLSLDFWEKIRFETTSHIPDIEGFSRLLRRIQI